MSEETQYVPWHVIAQAVSRNAFLEIIDTHSPFLTDFELPTPTDYKKDKFTIALTEFGKGKPRQLRHFVDKKELLVLVDQMSRGVKGQIVLDKNGKETEDSSGNLVYKPILQSFKGSEDRAYPQWEFTSRTLKVTYKSLNIGDGYYLEMVHQEGVKEGKGQVSPSGKTDGIVKASFALSIVGNSPSGLYIAHQTKNYLLARETARMELWARSRAALIEEARTNKDARAELEAFKLTYDKRHAKVEEDTPEGEDEGDE